jgi:hypothetical protein
MRIIHAIAHALRLNHGRVYCWFDADTGELMVGFRCDGCGCIQGVHKSTLRK